MICSSHKLNFRNICTNKVEGGQKKRNKQTKQTNEQQQNQQQQLKVGSKLATCWQNNGNCEQKALPFKRRELQREIVQQQNSRIIVAFSYFSP